MTLRKRMGRIVLAASAAASVVGCATSRPDALERSSSAVALPPSYQQVAARTANRQPTPTADNPIRLAADQQPAVATSVAKPAYAQLETLPIDLPTVIKLVDENSPAVGVAQARVREAEARFDAAEAQWLPNLSVGAAYTRFDGQTQNQRGEIFGVSRANLFAGGGPTLSLDFADAIYRPLIERRVTAAESLNAQATGIGAELDAVSAYLDLVQLHALVEINAETLKKAEAMLLAAQQAKEKNLDRTAGDVNRARTEVLFRKAERVDLDGRIGAASARLGKLLLLQPNVRLVPTDAVIAPLTLIDPTTSLDALVSQALANRPDLAANAELIAAAWDRVRRQQRGPLLPKLTVVNQTGGFGGGINDDLANFAARNALGVQLSWEIKNLGFGNRADVFERRAQLDQAQFRAIDAQARVIGDIVETAQVAAAKAETLTLAETAIREASELYRINKEGTLNVVDAKNLFDALRPLQAIQVLNQAQQNYLAAVLDFNRAQYRLFALVGNPPRSASPAVTGR